MPQTYAVDKQVTDSAGSATAFLSGVKTHFNTLGVTGGVVKGDCQASLDEKNRAPSILKWAQDAGKRTGGCEYNTLIVCGGRYRVPKGTDTFQSFIYFRPRPIIVHYLFGQF